MDDFYEDMDQIMKRMRENIRGRQQETDVDVKSPSPIDQIEAEIALLNSSADIYNISLASHRWILGPVVLLAKKILRRLLTPFLERQCHYNLANVTIVTRLAEQVRNLSQRQEAETVLQEIQSLGESQVRKMEMLRQQVEALSQGQMALEAKVAAPQEQVLRNIREQVSTAERKLRRILYVLTDGHQEAQKTKVERAEAIVRNVEPEFDYLGFEERFRGRSEEIKERQRNYVKYFVERQNILDIGCGTGSFLELLKEAGIVAKGVDLDLDMILLCREKHLEVVQDDALAYLEHLPDESLGGIFSAQVIEHLPTPSIIQLIKVAYKKIQPGGVIVVETLNPESLLVHYRWFWMDLTHVRLIHPETLKFLFEASGFKQVMCEFIPPPAGPLLLPPLEIQNCSHEELKRFNEATDYLNKLLYGSYDYAIVGRK